jgi:soluble lytic murein transglycosylase-like protein
MTTPINPDPALRRAIDPTILHSIRQASAATATDFGLLMAQASQESGFRADAKSSTSSAAGLFQFVDSTWLDLVRRFGAKYGMGQLAQQIGQNTEGKPVVSDPALRKTILDLRQDPQLSAALAGEYTKLNQSEVERALGHPLQRADLYMAHFLGASGATSFLKAVETKGDTIAADLLPDAASANQAIFYDAQTGKPRTVAEIYRVLAGKIEREASDLGGLAASDAPASSPLPTASAGRPALNWTGVKLSTTVLDMMNVVALAALKMATTEGSSPSPYTPAAPYSPRERHSI